MLASLCIAVFKAATCALTCAASLACNKNHHSQSNAQNRSPQGVIIAQHKFSSTPTSLHYWTAAPFVLLISEARVSLSQVCLENGRHLEVRHD